MSEQCISGTTNLASIDSQYDFFRVIGVTENGEMLVTSSQMCALMEELRLHRAELERLNCLLGNSIVKIKTKRPCNGC